jgi:hypothetical protein
MLVHGIHANEAMAQLGFASKLNVYRRFLTQFRYIGHIHVDARLMGNFDRLGRESTVDIAHDFL